VDKWKISTPIKASNSIDTFGNACSVFVQESPYTSMMIEAEGEIHTQDAFEFIDDAKSVSPYYLLQQTNLTEPTEEMLEYFSYALPNKNSVDQILKLAEAIQGLIQYSPGETNFATTAAQSFAMKLGVCQDHAHIMLGLCRASGIPARYVSGYGKDVSPQAFHAVVEVFLAGPDAPAAVKSALALPLPVVPGTPCSGEGGGTGYSAFREAAAPPPRTEKTASAARASADPFDCNVHGVTSSLSLAVVEASGAARSAGHVFFKMAR
jgi:hypothetical protein